MHGHEVINWLTSYSVQQLINGLPSSWLAMHVHFFVGHFVLAWIHHTDMGQRLLHMFAGELISRSCQDAVWQLAVDDNHSSELQYHVLLLEPGRSKFFCKKILTAWYFVTSLSNKTLSRSGLPMKHERMAAETPEERERRLQQMSTNQHERLTVETPEEDYSGWKPSTQDQMHPGLCLMMELDWTQSFAWCLGDAYFQPLDWIWTGQCSYGNSNSHLLQKRPSTTQPASFCYGTVQFLYPGPTLHDGTVSITPIRHTWSASNAQCSRLQLLLKLA